MLDATTVQQARPRLPVTEQLETLDNKLHQLRQLLLLYADATSGPPGTLLQVTAESLGDTMRFFADQLEEASATIASKFFVFDGVIGCSCSRS